MKENWYALYLAIVKGLSVEEAFYRLQPRRDIQLGPPPPKKTYEQFPISTVDQTIEMKKTMSYKRVAQYFGTLDRNVYNHIKKYYPGLIKSGMLGNHANHSRKCVS